MAINTVDIPDSLEIADGGEQQLQIPNDLPVLPLRDIVIYPFMIVPLFVSREKSIRAVDEALGENRMILLASQRDLDKEEPAGEDLYNIGTVAVIMRMLKLPDGRIRILVQGLARAVIESVEVGGEYLRAKLQVIQETNAPERSLEVEALIRNVRASMEKAANLGKNISPEVMAIIANLDDAGRLADLSASNLELKVEDAQSVLDISDTTARLRRVNELLNKEIEVLTVQQEINTQARADIDRSQREFYLRQQLKAIQSELGEGNELAEEVAQLRHLFRQLVAFAEFGLNGLQLLPEIELALRAVNVGARLRVNLLLDREDFDLFVEKLVDAAQARGRVRDVKDRLRVLYFQFEIRRGEVCEASRLVEAGDDRHHFGRDVLAEVRRALH